MTHSTGRMMCGFCSFMRAELCVLCPLSYGVRFVMIKKNHTFATEIGPIVQWIEWRFPKP